MDITEDILDIKTVNDCNRCFGGRILHPQAAIINLENPSLEESSVKFEFYAIMLIEDDVCNCRCCGRRYYDFSNATMVFLKPGEIFRMDADNTLPKKGLLLAFHPDLLSRTALDRHIGDYTFFSYRKEEALHLSMKEKDIVSKYFGDIDEELHHDIDSHSRTLVSRLIELLLDYCTRFYERQFITREDKNRSIMDKIDGIIGNCISSGQLGLEGFPPEELCAEAVNLSSAYFNDLLRFETGKVYNEYCRLKQFEAAKKMLVETSLSPSEIASRLGYGSVRQFSFIFRKLSGRLPSEYRFCCS